MAVQLDLPVVLPEAEWTNPLTRGLKTALVFDNGYAFDAAKGEPRAFTNAIGTPTITSAKATGRNALYTPNGSAANFALGEDWSGPSTIVWTSFIESVDNPWGGVLSKLSTGTSTQFAAQRNVGNDYFQLSRNYSASIVTARTLSSFLSAPVTFALVNESAAAASRFALYANGILVQSFNPAEAQLGGSGALLLGCENSSSATYDSSVFWDSVFRFDRALSDGEVAAIGTNPRQLLVQERRIWVPVSAGSGASAALTGVSATAAAGTATASITAALLGSTASAAAGSVAAGSDVTTAITGTSATAAAGTLAASISTAITGTSATAAAGTLSAATSTSVALAGVSSTTAAGTLAASISAALTGVTSTTATGTLSAGGDAAAAVTGQAASTAQGTVGVTVSGAAALSGEAATAATGTVGAVVGNTDALTGADAAIATGTLAPTTTVALTGAAAVIAAGDILVTVPTIGRPASDTSNSGWSPSTGVDLYAMLDEVAPDALDYIVATSVGALCELELDTTAYPGTASQTLKYRASSSTGNSVIVRLKNTGGATIRTETQVLTSVDTEYSITLTAPEIAAITSGALSVQLESA